MSATPGPPWLTHLFQESYTASSQTAGDGAVLSKEPHLPQAALLPAFTTPHYTRSCCFSGLANSWEKQVPCRKKITPTPPSLLPHPVGTDLEQQLYFLNSYGETLTVPLTHPLVAFCICPAQKSSLQPWCRWKRLQPN